jgi:hypothetical protein
MINTLFKNLFTFLLMFSVVACSTTPMENTKHSKPGFANINDIPIPEASTIDMNRSMIMGGGDKWTGHLVYTTKKSHPEVIEFLNTQMLGRGWTKISELRSIETVITFMKEHRIATIRILVENGYISNRTVIAIDMTRSNLTQALVNTR